MIVSTASNGIVVQENTLLLSSPSASLGEALLDFTLITSSDDNNISNGRKPMKAMMMMNLFNSATTLTPPRPALSQPLSLVLPDESSSFYSNDELECELCKKKGLRAHFRGRFCGKACVVRYAQRTRLMRKSTEKSLNHLSTTNDAVVIEEDETSNERLKRRLSDTQNQQQQQQLIPSSSSSSSDVALSPACGGFPPTSELEDDVKFTLNDENANNSSNYVIPNDSSSLLLSSDDMEIEIFKPTIDYSKIDIDLKSQQQQQLNQDSNVFKSCQLTFSSSAAATPAITSRNNFDPSSSHLSNGIKNGSIIGLSMIEPHHSLSHFSKFSKSSSNLLLTRSYALRRKPKNNHILDRLMLDCVDVKPSVLHGQQIPTIKIDKKQILENFSASPASMIIAPSLLTPPPSVCESFRPLMKQQQKQSQQLMLTTTKSSMKNKNKRGRPRKLEISTKSEQKPQNPMLVAKREKKQLKLAENVRESVFLTRDYPKTTTSDSYFKTICFKLDSKLAVGGPFENNFKFSGSSSSKRVRLWSVDDVSRFVASIPGCERFVNLFISQEIDGEALILIKLDDMIRLMQIQLGPALKIFNYISKLKFLTDSTFI